MSAMSDVSRAVVTLLSLTLAACSGASPRAQAPAERTASVAAVAPAPAAARAPALKELPELGALFHAEQVAGTIALLDTADGVVACSDVARCQRGAIPASTFKIPNALIAVELGVLQDSDSAMPWDGKEWSNPDWNRDHTLRTAMRVSCVPCFLAVARSIGPARMQDFLKRFDYGNHDISSQREIFWLFGALRITPLQQVDFLRRMDEGKLPVSERTLEIVRDVITLDVGPNHVFRGKTGSAGPGDSEREWYWFVGWVELGERRVYFATLIDEHAPDVDVLAVRRRVTEAILRKLAVLPT